MGDLHVLDICFAPPPCPSSLVAVKSRIVCHSGTGLPRLPWNTDHQMKMCLCVCVWIYIECLVKKTNYVFIEYSLSLSLGFPAPVYLMTFKALNKLYCIRKAWHIPMKIIVDFDDDAGDYYYYYYLRPFRLGLKSRCLKHCWRGFSTVPALVKSTCPVYCNMFDCHCCQPDTSQTWSTARLHLLLLLHVFLGSIKILIL